MHDREPNNPSTLAVFLLSQNSWLTEFYHALGLLDPLMHCTSIRASLHQYRVSVNHLSSESTVFRYIHCWAATVYLGTLPVSAPVIGLLSSSVQTDPFSLYPSLSHPLPLPLPPSTPPSPTLYSVPSLPPPSVLSSPSFGGTHCLQTLANQDRDLGPIVPSPPQRTSSSLPPQQAAPQRTCQAIVWRCRTVCAGLFSSSLTCPGRSRVQWRAIEWSAAGGWGRGGGRREGFPVFVAVSLPQREVERAARGVLGAQTYTARSGWVLVLWVEGRKCQQSAASVTSGQWGLTTLVGGEHASLNPFRHYASSVSSHWAHRYRSDR